MATFMLAQWNAVLGQDLTNLDWSIIAAFLLLTTLVAIASKGRQSGVRDFFLANRGLPWILVCISLMATEISAVGFVGVPYYAYSGSLTYLQLAIGAIIARFIIAYYFVPAFYEQETYSPYHFVGRRLGLGAERTTGILFMIGAILGQGVRVFAIASVLYFITGMPIGWAIVGIAAFSALWAFIGGIRTVVWTDLVQFIVMGAAALAAGLFLVFHTPGGSAEIVEQARNADKLRVWDFTIDQVVVFTMWTGLLGSTFNTLASHGADHMNVQRILCCSGPRPARLAVLWSSLSQAFVLALLCIGLALYAYYQSPEHPLLSSPAGEHNIFPIFIATALPTGLKGLLIIGLLGAAMSSLDSAIAALSQTTVRAFFRDPRPDQPSAEKRHVYLSRFFILMWSVVVCGTALYVDSITVFGDLVSLAFKTTSLTYGALLGALLLALLVKKRDGRGILFAAPIAVLTAFGISWHQFWSDWVIFVGIGVILVFWFYALFKEADSLAMVTDHHEYVRRAWYILLAEFPRTIWVLAGCALVYYLHSGEFYEYLTGGEMGEIAWPWFLPMGIGITVVLGYLLGRPVVHGVSPFGVPPSESSA